MGTPSMMHHMDFVFEGPYAPPYNPATPALSPVQPTPPPGRISGHIPSVDPVADLRARWASEYSHLDLPPPPPGFFPTREDMITAAKRWATDHGYTLVIGHSAKHAGEHSRCWLTCDLGGVYRNRHRLTPDQRKRKRESRKLDCPMKVLGTKRRYADGWTLHLPDPERAVHNHGQVLAEGSPPPEAEFPQLEEALAQWHREAIADGNHVHGNTLKAKAMELYKSLGIHHSGRPPPDFANGWLKDYRRRQGLPVKGAKPLVPTASRTSSQPASMETALPIPEEGQELIRSVNAYAQEYMSKFDASHDYKHTTRVVALANRIYAAEKAAHPEIPYDPMAVFLSALLHDVGDHKYAEASQDGENQVAEVLLERGASDTLALKVQMIVKNVSYTTEAKNPRMTRAVVSQHPELAIVQDADRLDAIGAVGIGRAFTFGGAKRRLGGMDGTIDHFDEKLLKLASMMKTEMGRRMAEERKQRLEVFKAWWAEETAITL